MEGASLVVEGLARLAHSLLTSAQGTEVLGGAGHDVAVELKGSDSWIDSAILDGDDNSAAFSKRKQTKGRKAKPP